MFILLVENNFRVSISQPSLNTVLWELGKPNLIFLEMEQYLNLVHQMKKLYPVQNLGLLKPWPIFNSLLLEATIGFFITTLLPWTLLFPHFPEMFSNYGTTVLQCRRGRLRKSGKEVKILSGQISH